MAIVYPKPWSSLDYKDSDQVVISKECLKKEVEAFVQLFTSHQQDTKLLKIGRCGVDKRGKVEIDHTRPVIMLDLIIAKIKFYLLFYFTKMCYLQNNRNLLVPSSLGPSKLRGDRRQTWSRKQNYPRTYRMYLHENSTGRINIFFSIFIKMMSKQMQERRREKFQKRRKEIKKKKRSN